MSVLDDVLNEELNRLIRMREAMQNELSALPHGYISHKRISGKVYCYLQRRENGKIISLFIKQENLQVIEQQIAKKRQLKASIREIDRNLKKLRRVLK